MKVSSRSNAFRFCVLIWLCLVLLLCSQAGADSSILSVNYQKLLSRADLTYKGAVPRSEEGIPVGNGTMGTLIWTSPSAIKFQINRVDVYANNSYSKSFNRRDWDFAYGLGYVNIDFVDFGDDVFPDDSVRQHLSVYDALAKVDGRAVSTQILAWHERDVMAVKVTDKRKRPTTINTNLRMLRHITKSFPGQEQEYHVRKSSIVRTKHHTATSKLRVRRAGGAPAIVLVQEFEEGDYYCSSAVAIGILGRKSKARIANITEARLSAKPGKGNFTILIATAATFDRKEDVVTSALANLEAAAAKGFKGLLESNKKWWHNFWSKAFVHLRSADGDADLVEQHYNYFLYLMASSSRGKLPPRYGGMIWSTEGDWHAWGAQHWWNNATCYYRPILPSNRPELMDPMFSMYTGMYEAIATAARQQWDSKGVFIPETHFFNGPEKLPEDIAKEMRELYLLRKPWSERSQKFRDFAFAKHPHNGRWNWRDYGKWVEGKWVYTDKGQGPYGHTNHLLSPTAKIPYQYWQRYEYTMDKQWLRDHAYPMIKGGAEFYRNLEFVRKGPDGKYHIYYVNNHETFRGYQQDTMAEVAAMHGIFPIAIRASEILNVDADLRAKWRELLDNLTPLPTIIDRETGLRKFQRYQPIYYYDLFTLETQDPEKIKLAEATFFPNGIAPDLVIAVLSRTAASAAILGRTEIVKFAIPNQIKVLSPEKHFCCFDETGKGLLANRMTLREGVNAIGAQRLGIVNEATQLALCQSAPPAPGGDTVIRVFPAWPKEWDAQFTLLCRGAFLVTSSMRKGRTEFVEIESQAGSPCRIRNPWNLQVTVYRDGRKWKDMDGSLLQFQTAKNQTFVLVPKGTKLSKLKRVVLGKGS